MKKGLFISIEGLDGSGKSTQVRYIQEYLHGRNIRTLLLREPGGTKIGEKVRDILLDARNTEMDSVAEMLLYASSRAQIMAEKVIPALEDGITVICDRFIDSSIAYQGYGRELDINEVYNVNYTAVRHILPDITFFLDQHPDTSLKRRKEASKADRLENEKMEFHNRVYKGYKELCSRYPERIKVLDAGESIEEIGEKITKHLESFLERM
ncbi:MAG TPA: dTMP kinase [Clostridia bacterium]|nr:dTMP kinase [Clostridia bacterium]HRX43606.1 dTMP kinase [Clostridia bacterium]